MTTLQKFAQLAAKNTANPKNCLALYVELLEIHILNQEQQLEIFQHELDKIILELSQEQS